MRTMSSHPSTDLRSNRLYSDANCQVCHRAFTNSHKAVQLPWSHLTGRTISPAYAGRTCFQGHETCPVCGNGISALRRSFISTNSPALYRTSHSTTRMTMHSFSHRSRRPASLTPGPGLIPPPDEYPRGSKILVPTPCHSSPRIHHPERSPVCHGATRGSDHPPSLMPAHGKTSSHHSRLYSFDLRNSQDLELANAVAPSRTRDGHAASQRSHHLPLTPGITQVSHFSSQHPSTAPLRALTHHSIRSICPPSNHRTASPESRRIMSEIEQSMGYLPLMDESSHRSSWTKEGHSPKKDRHVYY